MDLKKNKLKKPSYSSHFMMILLVLFTVVPFLLVVSISFSTDSDIAKYGYELIPRNFTLDAYKYVFTSGATLLRSYMVTIFTTVVGTFVSVCMMCLLAYPLSRKRMVGRKFFNFYVYFTMLFSGGMVPSYILITQYLHLGDNILVYILPGMISVWHVFVLRTFFAQLPEEMFEAAKIDGASELRLLLNFALPLAKPAIATVTLMVALNKWNDWMTSLLYINTDELITLQYLLQRILKNIDLVNQMATQGISFAGMGSMMEIPAESARMAMAIVVAGPMLLVFPFFQKYFVKGLTVGSIKG